MQYVEALIVLIVGVAWGVVSMVGATYIAPVGVAPIWLTVTISALMFGSGLMYGYRRWGIGFYFEPDDRVPATSTMEHAAQRARVQKWNHGINAD